MHTEEPKALTQDQVRNVQHMGDCALARSQSTEKKALKQGLIEAMVFIDDNLNRIGSYVLLVLAEDGSALVTREMGEPTEGVTIYGYTSNTHKGALAERLRVWSDRISKADAINMFRGYPER